MPGRADRSWSRFVAIPTLVVPRGRAEFVRALERETKRLLALQKRGPKKKAHGEERRGTLSFGAWQMLIYKPHRRPISLRVVPPHLASPYVPLTSRVC
jgi:hypothetical protein